MRLYSFVAAAALLSASLAAHANTIDFNTLPGNNGDSFASYTEAGFLVQNSAGQYLVGKIYGNPVPSLFSGYDETGASASITITAVGGGAFSFLSADLASDGGNSTYAFSGSFNGVPIFPLQTGTVVDGGFRTFNSTSPSVQLTSLTITENGRDYNVDNIVVNPSATAVTPEPSSIALLGTGLLGVAGMLRKRCA